MPVQLDRLVKDRFLLHVTYARNLDSIRSGGRLYCASKIMEIAKRTDLATRIRDKLTIVEYEGVAFTLTDNVPLYQNQHQIDFYGGWDIDTLREAIDQRVFFWLDNGMNAGHVKRYKTLGEELIFLRLPLGETFEANKERGPEFCKYNSGAPPQHVNTRTPRGPRTFSSAITAECDHDNLKEVVFRDYVDLPKSAKFRRDLESPFSPLFR